MDGWSLSLCLCPQVIQTISAVDKDNPSQGHTFHYRLEMLNNPNFTIKNNLGMFIYTIFFSQHLPILCFSQQYCDAHILGLGNH